MKEATIQLFNHHYQKPELTDHGSVVTKTRATKVGWCWDGSPDNSDDTKPCDDIAE